MRWTRDETADSITITCTLGELSQMHDLGWVIYAGVDPRYQGLQLLYGAPSPGWPTDVVVATVDDFLAVLGWGFFEDDAPAADGAVEITVTIHTRHPTKD